MFRRILIPTDFSTASEWAFDEAVHLAAASRGELLILHVRRTWAAHPGELRFPADPALYDYAEQQELTRLKESVRRAHKSLPARLIVRHGHEVWGEIAATVEEEKADLVVMASHARHHVAHLIIGSTTLSLLKSPPVPLLLIRYGTKKRKALGRVVIPMNPGQERTDALELARTMSSETHVIAVAKKKGARLDARLQEIAASVPGGKSSVLTGDATREIVRFAAEIDAEAILLDAGSGAEEERVDILRHAPCPVLILPARRAGEPA